MKNQNDLMREQAAIDLRISEEREKARLAALQAEVEASKPKRRTRKTESDSNGDT